MTDCVYVTKSNGQQYTVRNNRDRFFYPVEWMKTYDAFKRSQQYTFQFLINTGCRINEARHVESSDIDILNKRIVVRKTKIKAAKKETRPRPRIIPVSTQFARYLRRQHYETVPKVLTTPGANIALKKALKAAGINDWEMFSIHNIRKTFEIWLMALGVDGLKIVAHLGHSTGVAARHYISPDIFSYEEKGKVRDILGDIYTQ